MTFLLHLLIGALGGLSATGPMTILMERLHRHLPPGDRHALPPRQVTNELEETTTGGQSHGPGKAILVLLNHFSYGALAGAIFTVLGGRRARSGLLYGTLVWLVSYSGLLPALSLLRPATAQSRPRNLLMLTVHLLWGAVLGLFVATVGQDWRQRQGALLSQPPEPDRDRTA